mmetsp:Transcript_100565/g.284971  ORF Transcript_100565/g.284971 Transcript_100565/m.284971 type:complete len:230 (+) Transcript_100565:41-730(+)
MPHENMMDKMRVTVSALKTRSRVSGFTPPFASVDATTAICWQVSSMEHQEKYASRTSWRSTFFSSNSGKAFCSSIIHAKELFLAAVPASPRNVAYWKFGLLRLSEEPSEQSRLQMSMTYSTRPHLVSFPVILTKLVVMIAPALIRGLCGMPSGCLSTVSLKLRPEGSLPTCSWTCRSPQSSSAMPYVMGFDVDWIENGSLTSPTSSCCPWIVHADTPHFSGSALASCGM